MRTGWNTCKEELDFQRKERIFQRIRDKEKKSIYSQYEYKDQRRRDCETRRIHENLTGKSKYSTTTYQ